MIWRWSGMRDQPWGYAGGKQDVPKHRPTHEVLANGCIHAGQGRHLAAQELSVMSRSWHHPRTRGRPGSRCIRLSWAFTAPRLGGCWTLGCTGLSAGNGMGLSRLASVGFQPASIRIQAIPSTYPKWLSADTKVGACLHRVGRNPDVVDGNGPSLGLQCQSLLGHNGPRSSGPQVRRSRRDVRGRLGVRQGSVRNASLAESRTAVPRPRQPRTAPLRQLVSGLALEACLA